MRFSPFLLAAVVLAQMLGGCGPRTSSVEIVRDGAPLAEIVIAEEPLSSVRQAAKDLQEYIGKISGAELPIVHAPSGNGVLPVYVGDSASLAALGVDSGHLPPEGFLIDVSPSAIVLMGRDEQRDSFPFASETGKDNVERWMEFSGQPSLPPQFNYGHFNKDAGFRTLDATGTLYAVAEFLEQLGVRWYAPGEDGTVIPQSPTLQVEVGKIEKSPRFPYREVWYSRAASTDTEGFMWLKRLKYGSSYQISNEAHSTRNILRSDQMLEENPEFYGRRNGSLVSGNDGASPKLSNSEFRDASHQYAQKAFEADPGLLTMTLGMPDGFGQIDEEDAAKWVNPEAESDAIFSNYVWDYWLDMASRLKESNPDKLLNCYSYAAYQQPPDSLEKLPENVALTMIYYLQGKLYWDPNLDLQALLDEFYELYYGPAREPMKEFWEFAEEVWTRPKSRSITPTTGFMSRDDAEHYFELLETARSKVQPGDIYDRRIAALETEMAPLRNYFDRLERTGPKVQGRLGAPPETLDGNLDKPFWQDGPWYDMRELVSGNPLPERLRTRVAFRLSPDRSMLYVGVICGEPTMDGLTANAPKNDDPAIFNDDTIEIYLESPERSFFKIVVNSEGVIWDETQDGTIVDRDTLPLLWNPGIEAAISKSPRSWSAEIAIPTKDLGDTTLGPAVDHPWGINVCRARWINGEIEAFAISPTGELFFGKLTSLGSLSVK